MILFPGAVNRKHKQGDNLVCTHGSVRKFNCAAGIEKRLPGSIAEMIIFCWISVTGYSMVVQNVLSGIRMSGL